MYNVITLVHGEKTSPEAGQVYRLCYYLDKSADRNLPIAPSLSFMRDSLSADARFSSMTQQGEPERTVMESFQSKRGTCVPDLGQTRFRFQ